MGISDSTLKALRRLVGEPREQRDKAESPSAEALRHTPASTYAIWGREDIGGMLSVSQALMDRYADYEAMNDYPDIRCFTGEMKVYVVENSVVTPLAIKELAINGEGLEILAWDTEKKQLTKVAARHPRLSAPSAPVLKIPLSNGEHLRVTVDHKILTAEKGYVEAKDLVKGDLLLGFRPGFATAERSVLTSNQGGTVWVNSDPVVDGVERVYDVTTETHNLIVNGVVCHNSAFHYFANDAVQPNLDNGRIAWVVARDQAIVGASDTLIKKRLRLEDELFGIAYGLDQYGNEYNEVLVNEHGVVGLNHLAAPTMRRVEKLNGSLVGFVQDVTGRFTANQQELRRMLAGNMEIPRHVALMEDWQVVHMRLRSHSRRSPYGVSVGEGARWIWKRLVMLEDAVMIYKLTRAPARYAFYVDVTDVPSNRVESFLKRAKRGYKKKSMVNPNTGRMDFRYSPLANDEDIWIAVREGRELSRVEVLSGPDYQNVDDVQYFQRKLHGALMVPRAYLGQDEPVQGKAILSNEDVRAARVTLGIQKELRLGIEHLIRVDLAARGHPNPWNVDFEVMMTVPSGIYELAHLEVANARADLAARMQPFTSTRWIQEHIFKMSDDDIETIDKQRKKEAKQADDMGMSPNFGPFTGGKLPDADAPPPELPPEMGGAPPQGAPQQGGQSEQPPQGAPQSAWKIYDQRRRLEERRDTLSRQNHQQLVDQYHRLIENDRQLARRMDQALGFMRDFREAAVRRQNGQIHAAPSAPRRFATNGR